MFLRFNNTMIRELLAAVRFGFVGISATLVHVTVFALAMALGIETIAANSAAFAVAFGVSYIGNRFWTFRAASHAGSLPRYGAVAVGGFAVNCVIAWTIVDHAGFDYLVAAALMLLITAPMTFVCSRFWAFRLRSI